MTVVIEIVRTAEELAICHAIRREVFVVEQQVPVADEWDDLDPVATHFLLFMDGVPVGTARMRVVGDMAKLERIALIKEARGKGYGELLMQHLTGHAKAQGLTAAKLSGQIQAQAFYEKLGFIAERDVYMDAGIPHRLMVRRVL